MINRFFEKGSFKANVLTLISGTVLAQAIPLLISPILTRIYSPEEFGSFGVYMSILMILSVIATGRYEFAIILPKNKESALNVASLSILITATVSIFTFIMICFFNEEISILVNSKMIVNWLFLLPISLFLLGVYQTLYYWNNRLSGYQELSISRVVRSVNTSGFGLVFGLIEFLKKGGLILGDILGQISANTFLIFRELKLKRLDLTNISWKEMKNQAVRYDQFPKYNVPSGLVEKLSGQLPVLFLSSYFSAPLVGFFTLSQRVVSAPSTVVGRAIGDVFRQEASEEYLVKGNCRQTFLKLFKKLVLLSVLPFLLLFFISPWAFSFIFGEEWRVAGEYSQIMAVMYFLQFITSPLSNMFLIAEKQKIDLFLQIFLLAIVLMSFILGYRAYGSSNMCILLFTLAYSIKYVIELYLSYRFSMGDRKPNYD